MIVRAVLEAALVVTVFERISRLPVNDHIRIAVDVLPSLETKLRTITHYTERNRGKNNAEK